MENPPSPAADRVGPFVAGSTATDLIGLARHESLGLALVDREEQKRDRHEHRYGGLDSVAREFFFDYDGSSNLVFQKTVDSELIPDFAQLIYCWLAQDRLGGLIFFGVNSDVGTHEQIDQQESAFWEQAAELAEALATKYTAENQAVLNYFNFAQYPTLPRVRDFDPQRIFSGFSRLATAEDNQAARSRIETHYWGPTIVLASDRKRGSEVATTAAQTSQVVRRIFRNDEWFVIVNHAVERYVRTIESLHVFTKLVYLSRQIMDDLGRTLNSRRGKELEAEGRKAIESWEESLKRADQERQVRIARLSQIL